MNMREFYEKHGIAGLEKLAEEVGTTVSYLRQLIYSKNKNPSLKMAIALVDGSGNQLSFEALAYPNGPDAE